MSIQEKKLSGERESSPGELNESRRSAEELTVPPERAAVLSEYSTKKVFFMSVPLFVELVLQMLVGNVDQIMMSQSSQEGVAAIGNCNQIMNIVIIFLNVMSMAAMVLISQYRGSGEEDSIRKVCSLSLLLLTGISMATMLAVVFLHRPIFAWMSVPEEVMDQASLYITIVGCSILIQGLYMVYTSFLRGYGMVNIVMVCALVMNLINIVGNALLINGLMGAPALGIAGAGISTAASKCIGFGLAFYLTRKYVPIQPSISCLRPFPKGIFRRLLYVGVPLGGEELAYSLSQICILKMVNAFGTLIIATKVYCSMLANIAYIYTMAIGQATQIAVSYFIGAKSPEMAEKRVWTAVGVSIAVSEAVTVLLLLGSDAILGIFTDSEVVLTLGKQILFVELFLELGRAINIVMVKCLVAVGDIKVPITAGVVFAWGVGVGVGWFLGVHMGMGLIGIWIAMAADECLRGLIFILRFRSGKWKGLSPV